MKLLANRKIKRLFIQVLLTAAFGTLLSLLCILADPGKMFPGLLLSWGIAGSLILVFIYLYLRDQSRMLEDAADRIRDYLSGNRDRRIACDEEGELYHLFHEVNSLAAVLNAHAENEARAKQFMKDTLSDISHQLKTPLAALNVCNGIIQEEAEDAETVREFAGRSERELDRIETLVRNLLKIARLDAETEALERRKEYVSEMMDYIEQYFSYRAGQEGKKLSFSGSSGAWLFCDRSWMTEALANLVKNGLDHTGRGDEIRVEWQESAKALWITVRDNGGGIRAEDLPHIFKRFYRSQNAADTQGTGLGLPLAKAVIEAAGGTIEADSEPGRGAVFTVYFPNPTEL